MSKYKDLIDIARSSEAVEPENQESIKVENQKTRKPENQEGLEPANLSIKIPKYLRRYWVSRAKAEGTTITAIIIEALENRFGKP